jgi:hypothetical protein
MGLRHIAAVAAGVADADQCVSLDVAITSIAGTAGGSW